MEEEANIDAGQDDGVKAGQSDGGEVGAVEQLGWRASLPDVHKNNEAFKQFKEPKEAWDKLDVLLKTEGKAVTIPDEKATDDEKAKFFAKLGRPENPDGYELTKPADLPESVPYDPVVETEYKKFAHSINLTKDQAAKLHTWYYGLAKNGAELMEKAQVESIDALKAKWGAKYDGNTKIAYLAFEKFAGDAKNLLSEATVGNTRLGDHPQFIETFYKLGLETMDDTTVQKGLAGGDIVSGDKIAKQARSMFPDMYKEK